MTADLSPRERIEIIVEQLRVAGMPLMGPEPDWRSLIEVWRLSLADALAAMPDVRHYTIEADGDTTPYILCRDDDACEWTHIHTGGYYLTIGEATDAAAAHAAKHAKEADDDR